MDNFDIPIFKKSYELYKTFHEYRKLVPKADRYTIFERGENVILDVLDIVTIAAIKVTFRLPVPYNMVAGLFGP